MRVFDFAIILILIALWVEIRQVKNVIASKAAIITKSTYDLINLDDVFYKYHCAEGQKDVVVKLGRGKK